MNFNFARYVKICFIIAIFGVSNFALKTEDTSR